jgi:hypothetical protein
MCLPLGSGVMRARVGSILKMPTGGPLVLVFGVTGREDVLDPVDLDRVCDTVVAAVVGVLRVLSAV